LVNEGGCVMEANEPETAGDSITVKLSPAVGT
jgi:hypothetical protein